MSSNAHQKTASITPLADREVSRREGDRPVEKLAVGLRSISEVKSAEIRVEGGDDDPPDTGVFYDAGSRELQNYGSSTRFAFSYAAAEISGFDSDESVSVYARDGGILLVSNPEGLEAQFSEYLQVELKVANVPKSVADLLDDYDARISPESVTVTGSGTLSFTVSAPSVFERVTDRNLRAFGSGQTILTIPKGALEISGLGDGDVVDVRAASGAVLLIAEG